MRLVFEIIFESTLSFAAGHEHEAVGPLEVPIVVLYQVINLGILVGILIYFTKDKVRSYFKDKKENYLKAATEVANLKRQIEEQAKILKQKIQSLETTAAHSEKQAKEDAGLYGKKLLDEAREQSDKLRKETERTVAAEIYKTAENLRAEVVDQAIASSRELIQKQIKDSDQKRLQTEFVEKIRVVEN